MPKRKADEAPSGADVDAVKSPVRKKSKKEQLAAAREWHDKQRAKEAGPAAAAAAREEEAAHDEPAAANGAAGAVGGAAKSPAHKKSKKEALAAARGWHEERVKAGLGSASNGDERAAPDETPSRSPLYEEATSSNGGAGGNAFLKSLRRGQKLSPAKSESEGVSPELNSEVASVNGSAAVPSEVESSPSESTGYKDIGIGGAILMIFLVLVNVAAIAYVVYTQQESNDNLFDEHVSEMDRLQSELGKSREVETLLRSGIMVLEQELSVNSDGVKDVGEIPTLYDIQLEHDNADSLQSEEERSAWLEGVRALDEAKHVAMNGLDEKLVGFGYEGGREKIMALEECLAEDEQSCGAVI